MKSLISCLFGGLFLAAMASPGMAADCPDFSVTDVQDHPLISRYQDSCLFGHDFQSFAAYSLVLGKVSQSQGQWEPENSQKIEGAITRLLYSAPGERGPLEVFRNYENDMKSRGFEILYQCANDACGKTYFFLPAVYREDARTRMKGVKGQGSLLTERAFLGAKNPYYLAAKAPEGGAYLSLLVAGATDSAEVPLRGRTIILAEVIESAELETRLIDASAMAKSIGETGRVALHNVYFDTGKAALKPESQPALQEMAELLNGNKDLKVYVVGHTDNAGGYESNLALSRKRAAAVVQALINEHGVGKGQLLAAGVASLSPVASNTSPSGRAENRRVELVQQ